MLITHNLLDGIIKIYLERLAQDELSNFNYTLSQYQRSNTPVLTRIQNSLGSNLVNSLEHVSWNTLKCTGNKTKK